MQSDGKLPHSLSDSNQGDASAQVGSCQQKGQNGDGSSEKKYAASIFPLNPLPDKFIAAVRDVESILKEPVWLIIQDAPPRHSAPGPFEQIDDSILNAFMEARASLPKKPAHVIIDSPGGQAKAAFQMANLLRLHCGGFNVYVYEWAKSAATLFALGASNICLSSFAELGPLDVQVFDPEREDICSALDEVQALERLNAFALQALDAGVIFLKTRSGKSVGTLLPHMLHFVSEMLSPLFEKLDTVHYTQMSRLLKIGEAYAIRLLEPKYGKQRAEEIARQLVNEYPEHGFYIDRTEANRIGLKVVAASAGLEGALENLKDVVHGMNHTVIIGQLKEV
jgi:hypothetical protein